MYHRWLDRWDERRAQRGEEGKKKTDFVLDADRAFLVEKVGSRDPRHMLARRLALGMPLQADPTVLYGRGAAADGELTRSDLRSDGPYNTYTRKGLPPTPIAAPGAAALAAAVDPAPGDALYFVARGDGGHVFSATLEDHQRAVRDYRARRAAASRGESE